MDVYTHFQHIYVQTICKVIFASDDPFKKTACNDIKHRYFNINSNDGDSYLWLQYQWKIYIILIKHNNNNNNKAALQLQQWITGGSYETLWHRHNRPKTDLCKHSLPTFQAQIAYQFWSACLAVRTDLYRPTSKDKHQARNISLERPEVSSRNCISPQLKDTLIRALPSQAISCALSIQANTCNFLLLKNTATPPPIHTLSYTRLFHRVTYNIQFDLHFCNTSYIPG